MEFLTPSAVIVATSVMLLGVVIKALVNVFFKNDPAHKRLQAIMFPAMLALVGFYATKVVEIGMTANESLRTVKRIEDRQAKTEGFLRAIDSIGKHDPEGTFSQLLNSEFGTVNEKLRQIAQGELVLRREEVIPKWEKLILNCRRQVRATNIVSLDDWKKFSPTEGEEVHRKAISGGAKIQRIFIFSGDDPNAYDRLLEMAKAQREWGVEVRMLDGSWLTESSFSSELLRDVGTPDVVLFDDECVLLTNVDGKGNIVSSILTSNTHRLQKAREFYSKLWEEAKFD